MSRLTFLIVLPALIGFSTQKVSANPPCSVKTLTGTYIVSASGTEGGIFSAYAGLVTYDGNGAYVIRIHYGGTSLETTTDHGRYVVVGPCEVEAISQSGRSARYFIDPSGENFKYVMTSGGSVVGDAQRISREFLLE